MYTKEWRKPFNISIGLHFIVLAFAMLAPSLFERQPRLPEVYTVNLFTAVEVAEPKVPSPAPAPKNVEKPAARVIEPEEAKPAVSIQPSEPEPVAETPEAMAPPVSLEPIQQKIKVGKTKEEEALERARLDVVKRQLQASEARKKARETAEKAARDAVSKLADAIKTTTPTVAATAPQAAGQTEAASKSTGISGPRGTGIEPDFYMKQYLSAVYQKIHDNWVLPDLQNWDNSLEAVLVITIRRDGTVTDTFFERKSDNIYFNQFVLKAIKDSSPLPPFPSQLEENTFEIGLRFKPGELY